MNKSLDTTQTKQKIIIEARRRNYSHDPQDSIDNLLENFQLNELQPDSAPILNLQPFPELHPIQISPLLTHN